MNIYSFEVEKSDGTKLKLSEFQNKVLLIVNVASKCGFTPQYDGLEELYKKHKDKGLVILGFPCNQFGQQEAGSDEEIQSFCRVSFGVSFPVLKKVDVNGDAADPLFVWLKSEAPGLLGSKAIKWNFTKFLVDRTGTPVSRFAPTTEPKDIEGAIQELLAANK